MENHPARPEAVAQAPQQAEDQFDLEATELTRLIEVAVERDRDINRAFARRAEALAAVRRFSEATAQTGCGLGEHAVWDAREAAARSLRAEVACALRIPEGTADAELTTGVLLTRFPATFEALRAGMISYRHVRILLGEATSLPEERWARFETEILGPAGKLTAAKFESRARRLRERLHPESIQVRKEKCLADRALWFQPDRDGMASLGTRQSADEARAVFDRVSDIARSLQGADEQRTLTQLRVDVATDLLLSGVTSGGLGAGVQASVHVTVPVLSLLGHDDEPAELEGYGPIDLETAKRLAGTATSFLRVLTHPETGCVLSVGKNPLRVTKDLKRWLGVRDETCRFPGCSRPARQCELDHTVDRQHNGPMTHDKLAHLCKQHHLLKHQTPWTLSQGVDGVLAWTSPAGRRYHTEPATRIRPAPVRAARPVRPPIDPNEPPPF